MTSRSEPPAVLRRWEALPGTAQFAISWPPAVALLWAIHVGFLNQPVFWRGIFYGVFWGTTLSLALVYATKMEAQKRRLRAEKPDDADDA